MFWQHYLENKKPNFLACIPKLCIPMLSCYLQIFKKRNNNNNAFPLRDREISQLEQLRKCHYIHVSIIVYHALIQLVCLSSLLYREFLWNVMDDVMFFAAMLVGYSKFETTNQPPTKKVEGELF